MTMIEQPMCKHCDEYSVPPEMNAADELLTACRSALAYIDGHHHDVYPFDTRFALISAISLAEGKPVTLETQLLHACRAALVAMSKYSNDKDFTKAIEACGGAVRRAQLETEQP